MIRYNLLVSLLVVCVSAYAQKKPPKGWEIVLSEGKEAYINLTTGEVSKTFPKTITQKPLVATTSNSIVHRVKKGETLFSIAQKYNILVDDIYRMNKEHNLKELKIGQEIVVKSNELKEKTTKNFKKEVEVKQPKNNLLNDTVHYVKEGETLFSISKNSGLTIEELKRLNNLTSNNIKVGQKLNLK